MIESWQIEHRPWLYFFLRRFELIRWTLFGKVFHKEARWYARLLSLYLAVTGFETERCLFCGWKVGVIWWCNDQELWSKITGYGEGGICCVRCFNLRAEQKNVLLRWSVGLWAKDRGE